VIYEVNFGRFMQSCNPKGSTRNTLSLAERIERTGRALTAAELAALAVSKNHRFQTSKSRLNTKFSCPDLRPLRSKGNWCLLKEGIG